MVDCNEESLVTRFNAAVAYFNDPKNTAISRHEAYQYICGLEDAMNCLGCCFELDGDTATGVFHFPGRTGLCMSRQEFDR